MKKKSPQRWFVFQRFTLVELLVVITIIAILASMLLPALEKTRRKGRQIICVNTMKGLGNYCMMYANDHNAFLPKYYEGMAWYEKLISSGYVKSRLISTRKIYSGFDCPMENGVHVNCNTDYAVNIRQFHSVYNQSLPRIPAPSECMLIIDAWDMYWTREPDVYRQYISPRHGEGANVLHGDIHAGWRKYPFPVSQSDSFWGGANQI